MAASEGSVGSGFEVDGGDVVKLVLQFLHEQGLSTTAKELMNESGVALNTVESKDGFAGDIRHGRWESVLPQVARMKLPTSTMLALYEQVVVELLECREVDLAREMLKRAPPLQLLRTQDPERFVALDSLSQRPGFDAAAAYGSAAVEQAGGVKHAKERRRQALAERIMPHVAVVPPSRLTSLLGLALRWQKHNGLLPRKSGTFDVFRGLARQARLNAADLEERAVRRVAGQIRFGAACHAECAAFSPDGSSLATGSVDGFIEVWDVETLKLRRDLPYQSQPDDERFMMHDKPVRCLCFSRDGELLASGAADGKVKVWKVSSGKRVKLFERAHQEGGVACLCFSPDSTQILSGGMDGVAKVHGLKSGKMLKEFRGHSSFVNKVAYVSDHLTGSMAGSHTGSMAGGLGGAGGVGSGVGGGGSTSTVECSRVLTASADGQVKVWELKSAECVSSFGVLGGQRCAGGQGNEEAIHTLLELPDKAASQIQGVDSSMLAAGQVSTGLLSGGGASSKLLLVVGRSPVAHVVTLSGSVVRTFSSGSGGDLVAACLSTSGKFAYCAAEDGKVYCFDLTNPSGPQLEQTFPALAKAEEDSSSGDPSAAKKARTGEAAGGVAGPQNEVLGLAHHPHRNLVASFSDDGLLKVWRP